MTKKRGAHNRKRFKKVGQNLYRDSTGRYYLLVKKGGKQFRRSLKTAAELKASSAYRRKSVVKQLTPFFKGHLVRAIGASEFGAWKIHRGAKLSARSWNIDVETMKQIFDYAQNTLRILID